MRLKSVEAMPIRTQAYASGPDYTCALVRITTTDGKTGWGETECPAPEAVCALIGHLLRYTLEDQALDPEPTAIGGVWYQTADELRTLGHSGGLVFDAMAAIDMALYDLASQERCRSVAALLSPAPRDRIPALWCGPEDTAALARAFDQGFRYFKLHYTGTEHELLLRLDELHLRYGSSVEVAVDARWRLDWSTGQSLGAQLDQRHILWLECPIAPDNPAWHGLLSNRIQTPIAIGQLYHSLGELDPFFQNGGMRVLQPEVGRIGVGEGMRACRVASSYCMSVAPRSGLSAGPKLAASIQLAAAAPDCHLLMYRPDAIALASTRLRNSPCLVDGCYRVDGTPGLGL